MTECCGMPMDAWAKHGKHENEGMLMIRETCRQCGYRVFWVYEAGGGYVTHYTQDAPSKPSLEHLDADEAWDTWDKPGVQPSA